MKSRNVIDKEICESKYRLGALEEDKNKSFYNGVVIRELFSKYNLDYTENDIKDLVNSLIPDYTFYTSREEKLNLELLTEKLMRFKEYMNTNLSTSVDVLSGGVVKVVHNITVDYSFILKNGNEVKIYKVKNKKNTSLKKSGRTIFTNATKSMELYLLQLAGEQLYPNAYVTPGIVFLGHKEDHDRNLVPTIQFNDKEFSNIVDHHFLPGECTEMNTRIEDIMNDTVKFSNKKCNTCSYKSICHYINEDVEMKTIKQPPKASGTVKFTPRQQSVINVEEGVYRVLAGAGSGKTTCIANRIVKLVKNGTHLNEILLITFTTKGVEELKEKITYWFDENNLDLNPDDLNVYTFNSFGQTILDKEYKKLGFTNPPQLFEKSESLLYIQKLLDITEEIGCYNYVNPFLDMPNAKGAVYQASNDFTILNAHEFNTVEEVEDILNVDIEDANAIFDLYLKYKKYMKDNNLIDYNDQVEYAYKLLCDSKNILRYGYEHVICDEFQDSDQTQINILEKLHNCGYNKSLMVVGDDSQSIFSWRGATSDNIINFHKIFPETKDIELIENFRSTREICELANKINDINLRKVDKQLIGVSSGSKPILTIGDSTVLVNQLIDDIKNKNLSYRDIAVITRNKAALLDIRKQLLSANIPCVLSISELLIDNQSVQHMSGFLKFLVNTTLDLSFAEYLQVLEYDTFEKEKNGALFYKYLDDKKIAFLDLYNKCITDEEKLAFMYDKLNEIANKNRAVESLVNIMKEKNFKTVEDASRFVENMIIFKGETMIEKMEDPVDAVVLTTAHSSKGREWENVYLQIDQLKYPNSMRYDFDKNTREVEEERRLLFVAITRAKKNLSIFGTKDTVVKEIYNALASY